VPTDLFAIAGYAVVLGALLIGAVAVGRLAARLFLHATRGGRR